MLSGGFGSEGHLAFMSALDYCGVIEMFKEYPDVMTVQQAAKALGVCDASVYRLIKEAQLGCRKIGRKILVPKICLIDYIQSARYNTDRL